MTPATEHDLAQPLTDIHEVFCEVLYAMPADSRISESLRLDAQKIQETAIAVRKRLRLEMLIKGTKPDAATDASQATDTGIINTSKIADGKISVSWGAVSGPSKPWD